MRKIKCPTCKNETTFSSENKFRPFCSERCSVIDLGAWAEEKYNVPVKLGAEQDLSAMDGTNSQAPNPILDSQIEMDQNIDSDAPISHEELMKFMPENSEIENVVNMESDLRPTVEGRDYYFENGNMVITEYFLKKRGYCCDSGCRHCPYR